MTSWTWARSFIDREIVGGSITKVELMELMDTLGIQTTPEAIDLMINEIDKDNDGEIDFSEFIAVMERRIHTSYSKDQVLEAFEYFAQSPTFRSDIQDRSSDHHPPASRTTTTTTSSSSNASANSHYYIHKSQLHKVLCAYGTDKLNEDQSEELLSQLETDGHGWINYREYIQMMMNPTTMT